jgi:hypothetical protein
MPPSPSSCEPRPIDGRPALGRLPSRAVHVVDRSAPTRRRMPRRLTRKDTRPVSGTAGCVDRRGHGLPCKPATVDGGLPLDLRHRVPRFPRRGTGTRCWRTCDRRPAVTAAVPRQLPNAWTESVPWPPGPAHSLPGVSRSISTMSRGYHAAVWRASGGRLGRRSSRRIGPRWEAPARPGWGLSAARLRAKARLRGRSTLRATLTLRACRCPCSWPCRCPSRGRHSRP